MQHLAIGNDILLELQDLALCQQLESLKLAGESKLCAVEDDGYTSLDEKSLLPKLKKFHCDMCLGNLSNLIEGKQNLVHLHLNCCHVGIVTKVSY